MTRVTFLVPFAFGMGGIPRTVFLVAGALAERGHEVEVCSLVQSTPEPFFQLDPRVRITSLMNLVHPTQPGRSIPRPRHRKNVDPRMKALDEQPSSLSSTTHEFFSALVDQRLKAYLSEIHEGVVVSTRPELAVASVRWTRPKVSTVLQEHNSIVDRTPGLREALYGITHGKAPLLDAFLTLTPEERDKWRAELGETPTLLDVIPNATPFAIGPAAALQEKVIIAAGRLVHQKGFERLIRAWAPIARSHPDWRLEIYGSGKLEGMLQQEIDSLGIGAHVRLAGRTDDMEGVLSGASAYAMSSRNEGLPMVLLEAMSKGVPPVSFDCPEGPRQLIDDGRTGLLVPEGDVAALSAALTRVIEDEDLRRRLGAAAMGTAADYELGAVIDRWEALFDTVLRRHRPKWYERLRPRRAAAGGSAAGALTSSP